MNFSRRTLLKISAAAATAVLTGAGCARSTQKALSNPGQPQKPEVADLLSEAADLILNAYPESASSAGIDTGKYSGLKSKLTDRSPEGQARIEADVKAMFAKLSAVEASTVPADEALNLNVVRTVFDMSINGFDLAYGDMALLNSNWSYRNSPYAVAQNTGAFVEIPSFLDASHSIETVADADAFLERMEAYAAQLDGESERTKRAGEQGVILPDFLMDKTLRQLRGARARSPDEWGIVASLETRSANMGGDFAR